jgi:TIGR03009 family protein
MPVEPAWVSHMSPGEKEWVDKVLAYWELKSDKIKTFECKFQRWDYDPIFGPKDKAKTFAEGSIKYAAPDKGLFRVEKLSSFVAATKPGEKENYIEQDATFGEHWVCDGIKVFEFDARNRKLIERTLPPEMRGRAIADGPLPFLFGAKAETIKARYWVRSLPETGNGKYWLEAVPKSRQDAQNFKLVHIVLDETDYLPERLVVFAPNYDPQRNPARQSYVFTDRKTTDANAFAAAIAKGLNPLGLFQNNFFEPKLPAGWQKIVQNDSPGGAAPPALEASRPMQPQPPRSPFSR